MSKSKTIAEVLNDFLSGNTFSWSGMLQITEDISVPANANDKSNEHGKFIQFVLNQGNVLISSSMSFLASLDPKMLQASQDILKVLGQYAHASIKHAKGIIEKVTSEEEEE